MHQKMLTVLKAVLLGMAKFKQSRTSSKRQKRKRILHHCHGPAHDKKSGVNRLEMKNIRNWQVDVER